MKTRSFVAALLFASVASLSVGAHAADAEQSAAKPAEMQMEKQAKPHSHVQEKTGMEQKMLEAETGNPNAAKDMSRHYHPRDGK